MNAPVAKIPDDRLAPGAHRTLGAFLVICCIPIAHLPMALAQYVFGMFEAMTVPSHLTTFGGHVMLIMASSWAGMLTRIALAALFFLYVFWICKRFRRVVVFNACLSIYLTASSLFFWWACFSQMAAIQEALRKR